MRFQAIRSMGSRFRLRDASVCCVQVSVLLLALVSGAPGQGVNDHAYVHKMLVNLESPPWRCVCFSVSRSSVIDTHQAENQVWVVSRHNDWASAVEQRDMLQLGSNTCSFCPATSHGSAQPVQFFVFENCRSGTCEIGVADSNYSEAGWYRVSSAYARDREAWEYACQLHDKKRRFSPDISQGKVNCATSSGGSSTTGLSGYRKIDGAFINGQGIGTAERGHTATSCAARCDSESRCKSFEVTGDWCSINIVGSQGDPSILTRAPSYTFYEKK